MNSLKTMMVHIDSTPQAASRLALARDLAQVHRARLTALFAVTPRFVPLPVPWVEGVPEGPLLDEVDPAQRTHARAIFDRVLHGTAASRFEDVGDEPPVNGLVRRARLTDLIVLGQPDPSDTANIDVPRRFIASVLIGSGTPGLVVPFGGNALAEPQRVLVAWKSTREAARALTSALPLLVRARTVHVVLAVESTGISDRRAIENSCTRTGSATCTCISTARTAQPARRCCRWPPKARPSCSSWVASGAARPESGCWAERLERYSVRQQFLCGWPTEAMEFHCTDWGAPDERHPAEKEGCSPFATTLQARIQRTTSSCSRLPPSYV